MGSKTTHVRVEKFLAEKKKIKFPHYTYNDVFKIGLSVVSGMERTGKFLYGNVWKKPKKK